MVGPACGSEHSGPGSHEAYLCISLTPHRPLCPSCRKTPLQRNAAPFRLPRWSRSSLLMLFMQFCFGGYFLQKLNFMLYIVKVGDCLVQFNTFCLCCLFWSSISGVAPFCRVSVVAMRCAINEAWKHDTTFRLSEELSCLGSWADLLLYQTLVFPSRLRRLVAASSSHKTSF